MKQLYHAEHHFRAPETVRDIIIGMSDGLTVPFAIAAGLSGAAAGSTVIVIAGLAEIAAGSISMGLGGYLAAKSDSDHYTSEEAREWREIKEKTQVEKQEVKDILEQYGLDSRESTKVVASLSQRPQAWVDFMMKFELGLDKPDPRRALVSAITIGTSYVVGGVIPLSPYIFMPHPSVALPVSVLITGLALVIFGALKGYFTGINPLRSSLETTIIGGVAASVAFALARLFS